MFADKIFEIYNGGVFNEETNKMGRDFVVNGYSKDVVTGMYVDLLNRE